MYVYIYIYIYRYIFINGYPLTIQPSNHGWVGGQQPSTINHHMYTYIYIYICVYIYTVYTTTGGSRGPNQL